MGLEVTILTNLTNLTDLTDITDITDLTDITDITGPETRLNVKKESHPKWNRVVIETSVIVLLLCNAGVVLSDERGETPC